LKRGAPNIHSSVVRDDKPRGRKERKKGEGEQVGKQTIRKKIEE